MDLTAQVAAAINAWLASVATGLLAPALGAAIDLLFRTPLFDQMPAIVQLWNLARGAAVAVCLLAWLIAGVLVMANGSSDARYTAKVLVPRVALAAVLANVSLALCGELIRLNNALVAGLLGDAPASAIAARLLSVLAAGPSATSLVAIVVGLVAAALALLLVVLFIGRALVLLLIIVVGPLALAGYAFPQTEDLARLWLRALAGLLFVQVPQAVLISIGLSVLTLATDDWLGGPASALVSGLVIVTLLYLLLRLPFVAYAWAFRQSPVSVPFAVPVRSALRAVGAL